MAARSRWVPRRVRSGARLAARMALEGVRGYRGERGGQAGGCGADRPAGAAGAPGDSVTPRRAEAHGVTRHHPFMLDGAWSRDGKGAVTLPENLG